ncbi:uncharacterized protein LOC111222346 [Seriola dumerili]|uniref:uncharacterized protein LOC111222346 n=1 Tax=Seriola dumerili TaxID=41447 RepID=UPI000BBE370B|nr:uncharacterized protein LOC111222346 [Seriola dumerili]XP_022601772.1 uncharacterized protein LOC111222346 [Seriola dumerili]
MDAICAAPTMGKERSGNLKRPLSTAERFPCTAPSINMDQHSELMDFLPKDYQYHICRYKAVSQSSSHHIGFDATVRMPLKSKEEILVWLKSMAVAWRVAHTRPTKGHRIIFKADYRCQHNTKPKKTIKAGRVSKNTDCPAKLKVTLVRTEVSNGQRSRNTDPHIPDYPTLVDICNIHNHNIHVADATVCRQDVRSEAQGKLTEMFEAGHSLSTALDVLKYDLQVQCEDDYIHTSAILDSKQWHSMIKEFSAMAQSNEEFQRAASAMMKAFHRLKGNPSRLLSAMHMFGHNVANSPALQQAQSRRRAANCAGPNITAHPTSVAGGKVKFGGRSRLTAGRPKKIVATMDHRYSSPKGVKSGTHILQ